MAYDNKNFEDSHNPERIFSKRIKAGKRRTYFFDVRETRGSDYFITITESKKRFNDDGYDRHKVFIFKEDFNKFLEALKETTDYVKTELLPNFDFDSFNHDYEDDEENEATNNEKIKMDEPSASTTSSVVDKAIENDDSVDSWKI